jgi:hypothetical protein
VDAVVAAITKAAAAALLLGGCSATVQPAPPSIDHQLLHQRVSYKLVRSDGQERAIPAAGSRATLIEFWVTYCKGCGRSLPRMQAMTASLRERGVQVELVAVLYDDESMDRVDAVVRSWGVTSPYLMDRGGHMWRQFHVPVPGFVVLDSHGIVRWIAPQTASDKQASEVALQVAQEAP